MSDVFNLPVNQNEGEFFKCVINMRDCNKAIGQMNSESWAEYAAHAINNHDKLVGFVELVSNANVTNMVHEGELGLVTQSDVISYLYKLIANDLIKEIGHEI